jgi:hypothetical protein
MDTAPVKQIAIQAAIFHDNQNNLRTKIQLAALKRFDSRNNS